MPNTTMTQVQTTRHGLHGRHNYIWFYGCICFTVLLVLSNCSWLVPTVCMYVCKYIICIIIMYICMLLAIISCMQVCVSRGPRLWILFDMIQNLLESWPNSKIPDVILEILVYQIRRNVSHD